MKKILLSIGMIGAVTTPITAVVACGNTASSPETNNNNDTKTPPKTNEKTQAEINADNLKALNGAKTFLEEIDLDNLSKINEKPSMALVSDIDRKEVLKKYLKLSDADLDNFKDINIEVVTSNPGDVNGTLDMTITLTKGDKEVQSVTVNLNLTNFLDNDTYDAYLDEKFFDDMHQVYDRDTDEWMYQALDPIKTSWVHSANWWKGSYHQDNGFNYQDKDASLQSFINNRDLNTNNKAALKDVLEKYVGVENLPYEIDNNNVTVNSMEFINTGIGNTIRTGEKEGFWKTNFNGWKLGYVAIDLGLTKGEVTKVARLFIIGWVPYQQNHPDV